MSPIRKNGQYPDKRVTGNNWRRKMSNKGGIMSTILNFFKRIVGIQTEDDSSNTTPTAIVTPTSAKKALCVGINDYPGTQNDLSGCVNDCEEWGRLLVEKFGFGSVTKLINSQATIAAVKEALTNLISSSQAGDVLAITYSGHGSTVIDYNGDEPTGRDQTLYLYDGNLIDDEIRSILSKLPDGVNITIICDSCHSGTVTRAMLTSRLKICGAPKPRYMPPKDAKEASLAASLPVRKRVFYTENDMKEVLLSGCDSPEYSYDASFDKPMGAFSYYATRILWKEQNLTYEQFHNKLRKSLPNRQYPQTPQCEGANKTKLMFA